jgi:hypothetical protein
MHRVHSDLDAVTAWITCAETIVQQTYSLHRKTNPSFIEEEAPFRNMHISRRESTSWSRVSRRLKPGITVLAKVSSNLTNRLATVL